MKALKMTMILTLVLVALTSILSADTGWYITQENNARGLVIPAYLTEFGSVILLDGSLIDLRGRTFSPGSKINVESMADIDDLAIDVRKNMIDMEVVEDQDGYLLLLTNSRIDREVLLYHLTTSTFEENDVNFVPKGAKKVNIVFNQQISSAGKYGVKIAILPNAEKHGESQKTEQKTKTGSVTTTTVSDKEATVLVK